MANLLSTTVNGSLLALNNGVANAYTTASNGRLYLGSSAQNDYSIYTHMENFGGNYTKLTLDWHTGIKIGASQAYGGIRFYNDAINNGGSKLFSVGEGDSHVRVENNLYVGNTIYNNGNAVIHAGNIGSQSVSYASNSGALGGLGVGSFLRDDGWNTYPGQDANTQGEMRVDFTYSNNAPYTGELIRFGSSGYSTQFNTSYGNSDNFAFRTRNGDNATWNAWRNVIHSGNIASQSVSYAVTSGTSSATTQTNFAELFIENVAVATKEFVTSQGYLTSLPSHNHDDRYLVKGGSWYGSGLPGSRWGGFSVSGGEIVFGDGLPNAGQMGILIDGAYLAGENNGFWSLASDNSWSSRRGMYWDGSNLNFTANSPTALFNSIRLSTSTNNGTISGGGDWGIRFANDNGWIQFGPANTSWTHIYSDKNFYMNTHLWVSGGYKVTAWDYNNGDGKLYATVFYDANDTNYYVDPNGVSRIYRLQVIGDWSGSNPNEGAINIRGNYPSMTFRNTISGNMWLRHMDGAGDIQHYFAPSGVDANDWSIKHSMRTDGTFQSNGSMRSPIFYDSENTGYYGDFASLSRVNEIGANKMRADTNGDYSTNQGWWSHDPYGYGWGKPHGSFRTLEVSSSGDFSNEPAMFRIHQWGSGAAEFWKPKGTILYLRETPGGSSTWFTKFEVQGSQNITGFLNVNGATEHTVNDNGSVVHGTTTNNRVFINGSIQLTNNNDAIVIGRGTATFLTDEELGFGWGGGWYMTESSYIRSRGSKSLHMNGGSVDYVGSLYLEGSVGVHLQPNAGSNGSLQVTGSKDGWHGVRFTGSNVVVMANTNEVGFHNNNAGWQFLWSAGTAYVYKGGTGGGTQATVLDSSNYSSYALPLAGGTVTGTSEFNAVTYPLFVRSYGNTADVSAQGLQVYSSGGTGAIMSFHRGGQYAVNMGLDSDNVIRIGGWSAASNRWQLDMSGNNTVAGSFRAPIFYDSDNTNRYLDLNSAAADAMVISGGIHISRDNVTGNGIILADDGDIVDLNDGYCAMRFSLGVRIHSGNRTGGAVHTLHSDGNAYFNTSAQTPIFLVNNHSDNTKGYRIHNTSGTSVSAMFTNSSNQLVIAAGALDQINLNKKVLVNGVALGVNVAPSATAGRIDASNDIVAYSSSDERLKENIAPIENALDKVKSLTGVEFDWKPEYKHAHGYEGHDTGIIAQQVQAVMPSAVRTNDTGFLAVRYEKLIGLLIEANKELAARVEELEKKLS